MRMLEIAYRLNERCLAALTEQAASRSAAIDGHPVTRLSELWIQVDDAARLRAARCPVLLLDLNFERANWWTRAARSSRDDDSKTPSESFFPEAWGRSILQEILLEAWSAARFMPFAVGLVFGMAPAVCATIADLKIPDLDRIVKKHARDLRPRWSENAHFWRGLLDASIAADDEALADHQLYCLQLLVDSLIPQHSHAPRAKNGRWDA